MSVLSSLGAALTAAGVTHTGLALLSSAQVAESGWFVVTALGGERIRLVGVPSEQEAGATAVVNGFDFSATAEQARLDEQDRELARQLIDLWKSPEGRMARAIVALLVDGPSAELNDLRKWLRDFKAAVAGAGSLAALKTAVNDLPNMPDRTMAQAVTAVKNKITGNA